MTIEFPVVVPQLPQELYDVVIDELAVCPDSWKALRQCALVNYSFYTRASKHLFSKITLIRAQDGSPSKSTVLRLEKLVDIIKRNPGIVRNIKSCHIETRFNNISRAPEKNAVFGHNLIASILNQLPALQYFTWNNNRGMLPWSFIKANPALVDALYNMQTNKKLRSVRWDCINGLPPFLFATAESCTNVTFIHVQPSTDERDQVVNWHPEYNTFRPLVLETVYGNKMLGAIAHGDIAKSRIYSRLREARLWVRCSAEADTAAEIMQDAANTLRVVVIKELPASESLVRAINIMALPVLRELTLHSVMRNSNTLPGSIISILSRTDDPTPSSLTKLNIIIDYKGNTTRPSCEGEDWAALDDALSGPAFDNLKELNISFSLDGALNMKQKVLQNSWANLARGSLSKTFSKFKSRVLLDTSKFY